MTETNRYNNGKIYKLVSNHTDKIYIGSTCKERLCQRLAKHKDKYKRWLKNEKDYTSSIELLKLGDVEIVLLESVNCNTKDELFKKEREYIEKYKDIIVNNRLKPIATKEEKDENKKKINEKFKEENKDYIKEYNIKYQQENKKRLQEKIVCDCGSNISRYHKSHHLKTLKHQTYLNSLQT